MGRGKVDDAAAERIHRAREMDDFARRASMAARQNTGDSERAKKPARGERDDTLDFGRTGSVPYSAIGTTDKATGVIQSEPKKGKPNFSFRPETTCSCLTCRKWKKRCDGAKPECSTCVRGGFVCGGYPPPQVMWRESGYEPPQVNIESKDLPSDMINKQHISEIERRLKPTAYGSNGPSTLQVPDAPVADETEGVEPPPTPSNEVDGTGECNPLPSEFGEESDATESTRVPSPWQGAGSGEAERSVAISAWQMINRLGRELHRLESETGVSGLGPSDSPEGPIGCASGSGSGSDTAAPTDSDLGGFGRSPLSIDNGQPSTKRVRSGKDKAGDSDNEDDRPSGKRANIAGPENRLSRPRFACPYQKYDPLASPFCCMPSTKNPEGGADTFARIKSHIFQNHDLFTRCQKCWILCKTEDEALRHKDLNPTRCIKKPSPSKYWMTEAQRHQIRGQRFVASSVDNWFHLFEILLPDAYPDGSVRQIHSPYYSESQPLIRQNPSPNLLGAPITPGVGNNMSEPLQGLLNTPTPIFPPQGTISSPPIDLEISDYRISLATLFPGLDVSIDEIMGQVDSFSSFDVSPLEMHNPPPPIVAPTPTRPIQQPNALSHTPSTSESTSSSGQSQTGSASSGSPQTFLQRDNERLRAGNSALQAEARLLRTRQGRAQGELETLGRMLEELLYLPSTSPESEDGRVVNVNQLFSVLDQMAVVRTALNSS